MKKKIFARCILGFPLGLALGYSLTILISLTTTDGHYIPCTSELIDVMGSEINAVLFQAVLCGLLGSGFAAASVIWEIEHWGLVKQTGIYFSIASVIMMPIAYVSYWMEHSLKGVLGYFGIFFFTFVIIWIAQYLIARRDVKNLNKNLSDKQNQEI